MRRLFALSMAFVAPLAVAAGGGGSDAPPSTYLELSPAFVVNVDTDGQGTGYAKAEVTLRFREAEAREQAETHVPWLRHEVVMLMSGRSAQELRTPEGQKQLRKAIRKAVSERLVAEVPSLTPTADQDDGDADVAQEQADQDAPGPVREVLLPDFIVQAR